MLGEQPNDWILILQPLFREQDEDKAKFRNGQRWGTIVKNSRKSN